MKKVLSIFTITVFALALSFAPALADRPGQGGSRGGDDVEIFNGNAACVTNNIGVSANTGVNSAGGSSGGDGGDSGKIEADKGSNTTGDGGEGGEGGEGGMITTGGIMIGVSAGTMANTNTTSINRCGCDDDDGECQRGCRSGRGHHNNNEGEDEVMNLNFAHVVNNIGVSANTGMNNAEGSEGGEGGDSGKIENDDEEKPQCRRRCGRDRNRCCPDNETGDGGDGGDGSAGGWVQTGDIVVGVETMDVLNTNMTRIRR